MPIAPLPDRAVLAVAGADGTAFLQGLVTCNVETLPPGEARLAALLTPQGKILFDFLLSRDGADGYRLDVAANRAEDLARRLTLYRLRAAVTLAPRPDLAVAAAFDGGETAAAGVVTCRDGRLPALGWRLYGPVNALPTDAEPETYEARRIALGVPEGGRDFGFADAFPHEALMDQLGGVDFRKGCYIGQEVVSRMHHRGTARTRLLPVLYRDGPPPEPGTAVTAGARSLGVTGSRAGARGLAMLRLDRLGEAWAAGEPVRAGTAQVEAALPSFATFVIPETAGGAVG